MFSIVVSNKEVNDKNAWSTGSFWANISKSSKSHENSVNLSKLFTVRKEFVNPFDFPDEDLWYVGLENVTSNTGDMIGVEMKKGIDIKSRSKIFKKGDIIYGRLRPYLNKVHLVENLESGVCSNEFIVLIPNTMKILPEFARWVLASPYILDIVSQMQYGSSLPRLNEGDLMEISFPLPSIAEQKKYETSISETMALRRLMLQEAASMPLKLMSSIIDAMEGNNPFVFDLDHAINLNHQSLSNLHDI